MLPENKRMLTKLAPTWGLNAAQVGQLTGYIELIEEWSRRTHLLSKGDVGRIVTRHIAESIDFCQSLNIPTAARVMDLGSGAGFPGVIIKILHPSIRMTLVDSKRMKSLFLQEVVEQLHLHHTEVICQRAEDLVFGGHQYGFDVIVSRAVASLRRVWEWSAPLLKADGFLAVQKGGDLSGEMEEMVGSFPDVFMKTVSIRPTYDRRDLSKRIVLVSRK